MTVVSLRSPFLVIIESAACYSEHSLFNDDTQKIIVIKDSWASIVFSLKSKGTHNGEKFISSGNICCCIYKSQKHTFSLSL